MDYVNRTKSTRTVICSICNGRVNENIFVYENRKFSHIECCYGNLDLYYSENTTFESDLSKKIIEVNYILKNREDTRLFFNIDDCEICYYNEEKIKKLFSKDTLFEYSHCCNNFLDSFRDVKRYSWKFLFIKREKNTCLKCNREYSGDAIYNKKLSKVVTPIERDEILIRNRNIGYDQELIQPRIYSNPDSYLAQSSLPYGSTIYDSQPYIYIPSTQSMQSPPAYVPPPLTHSTGYISSNFGPYYNNGYYQLSEPDLVTHPFMPQNVYPNVTTFAPLTGSSTSGQISYYPTPNVATFAPVTSSSTSGQISYYSTPNVATFAPVTNSSTLGQVSYNPTPNITTFAPVTSSSMYNYPGTVYSTHTYALESHYNKGPTSITNDEKIPDLLDIKN